MLYLNSGSIYMARLKKERLELCESRSRESFMLSLVDVN